MTEAARITTFTSDPAFLLIFAPKAAQVAFPTLTAPFTIEGVRTAFAAAKIPVTVSESVIGRQLREIVIKHRKDLQAERGSKAREREAVEAMLGKKSPSMFVRERSELVLRKQTVDDEIRSLTSQIGEAKGNARTRGEYLPVATYRDMERRLAEAKLESQAIQLRMGELRKEERARNRELYSRHPEKRRERLVRALHNVLDEETLQRVWDEVRALEAEEPDEPDAEADVAGAG